VAFYPEPAGAVQDILAVAPGKITFGKAAVINGIQQVGFANAIGAANAHDPLAERKWRLPVIFKLGE
jgi:hypothetical protein